MLLFRVPEHVDVVAGADIVGFVFVDQAVINRNQVAALIEEFQVVGYVPVGEIHPGRFDVLSQPGFVRDADLDVGRVLVGTFSDGTDGAGDPVDRGRHTAPARFATN